MDEHINGKKEKKRGGWKKVLLIVILVILALLVTAAVCVGLYVDHLMNQINIVPDEDSTVSSSEVEDILASDPAVETIDPNSTETLPNLEDITISTEAPDEEPEEVFRKDKNVINILLIGQDRRSGEGRARSDSMILATFNLNANKVTLTSFLRDAYVQIPGYLPQKLNHAYQFGGMSLLNETLWINYGVEIDGNVEVDFNGFTDLIDMLGGVDISLTGAEADYLNHEGWSLTSGMNHLTGEQALAYSRIRYIDTDYRRTERQRTVVMSVINKYKSQSIDQMLSLMEDALPMVTTNIDKGEIFNLVMKVAPMLASAEYSSMQIPASGTFKGGNVQVRPGYKNWFEYDIDFWTNRQLLREIFEETN